jgi:hypothetical protein
MRVEVIDLTEFTEASPDTHTILRGAKLARSLQSVERTVGSLIDVDELRSGIRVRAGEHTGAATFSISTVDGARVHVRVLVRPRSPYLDFGDVLGMLAVVEMGRWFSGVVSTEAGQDYVDALCRAMAQEAKRLVRRGLARSYVSVLGDLARPRGHIDPRSLAVRLLLGHKDIRCRYTVHTTNNRYNQYVASGLSAARRIATAPKLRQTATRLQYGGALPPAADIPERPRFYGGQYGEYRTAHDITALLLDGLGIAGRDQQQAAFVPFVVETNLLFQRFLAFAVGKTLGSRFTVRSERIRVFERMSRVRDRTLIPDIVVRDQASQRVALIIDAKYEASFPVLSAADYYQAYVYGDTLGRVNEPRPLPVLLAAPFTDTKVVDWQKVLETVDDRPHRPVTWLLGINVKELLRKMGVRRPNADEALHAALLATGAAV